MNVFELVGTLAIKGADKAKADIESTASAARQGFGGMGQAAKEAADETSQGLRGAASSANPVVAAVKRVTTALGAIATAGRTAGDKARAAIEGISNSTNPVVSAVKRVASAMKAIASGASAAKGKVLGAFDGIKGAVSPVVSGVKRIASALGSLSGAAETAKKSASMIGNAFSVALGNAISTGVGAVKGSIDSAISRVDTLQSFSTVMKNLGYDADVAQNSISLISDRLQGLPTATDSMVSMVQQLAASTGDLDKATQLGLAFNDMTVAAGAGADDAARAFEQYSKSLGKGKFELESWQTLQEVMPGQLKQVSEYMLGAGSSTMDLYNALKNGKISVDDFNEAMLKLDQDGTDSITAFSQAALTGSAGIQTSIANMKTAITRGMANIIEGIGTDNIIGAITSIKGAINGFFAAFQPVAVAVGDKLRELSAGTATISDVVGAALGGIGSVISTQLPLIVGNILNFLSENAPSLLQAAVDFFQGIAQAVIDVMPAIQEQLPSIINGILGFVTESIPSLLQTAIDLFCAIVDAVSEALPQIIAAIPQIIAGIVGTLWDNRGQILESGVNPIGALVEGIGSCLGQVASAAWEVVTEVANAIGELPGKALSWGADIIGNLVSGIKQGISSIAGAASDIASTIASYLHFSEPDVGPLSNFHTFMPDMMGLMADGIRDNLPLVKAQAENVASALDFSDMRVGVASSVAAYAAPATYSAMGGDAGNGGVADMLQRMVDLMTRFFPDALAAMDRQLVLDTGVLAGAMTNDIDRNLAEKSNRRARGL